MLEIGTYTKSCFNRRRVLFHNVLYSKQTGETESRIDGRCFKIGLLAIFAPTRKQARGFQSSGKLKGRAGVETTPPHPRQDREECPGGEERRGHKW